MRPPNDKLQDELFALLPEHKFQSRRILAVMSWDFERGKSMQSGEVDSVFWHPQIPAQSQRNHFFGVLPP